MANQRITFGEWLPDQPSVIGALTVAENVYPKTVGYGSIASPVNYSNDANENLTNVVASRESDGSVAMFAGGNKEIYKLNTTNFNLDNVSKNVRTVTTVARATNVVTITTSAAHGYTTGDTVTVLVDTNTGLNGSFTIASTPTTTTFTYSKTGTDITSVADTGIVSTVSYNDIEEQRWRFTQFNNQLIAANGHDKLQGFLMGTSTVFNDLSADAPKARYVTVVRDFVVSGYINDSIIKQNRVQWSALNDETSWTPSATTQADYQDIPDGGSVVGVTGGEFGLVFLDRSIHRMSYVGSPIVFQFDNISRNLGCYEANSIIQYQGVSFFLSDDGFYSCDGQNIVSIGGEKVDRYFFNDVDESYLYNMSVAVDPFKKLIVWAYPDKWSGGSANKLIIYNFQTKKWSSGTTNVNRVAPSSTAAITLEGLDNFSSSIDALQTSLDSRLWVGGKMLFSGVRGKKIITFTGESSSATISTGELSAENFATAVTLVKPIIDNGSANVSIATRRLLSEQVIYGTPISADAENRVSLRSIGKYHRLTISPTGFNWDSIIGADVEIVPIGNR